MHALIEAGAFGENRQVFSLQFLYLLGERAEVSHAKAAQYLWGVVFEGESVPVALGSRDNSAEFSQFLVARYALELFLGEQGVLLILFLLGYHQYYLLDLGLEEEQGPFDL
jgi:hypothetical protein